MRDVTHSGREARPAADWLSVEEALSRILDACAPLPRERVAIGQAVGRALAEDVVSLVDHPPWDNSAMDGFAVRARDVGGASPGAPVLLPVVDDVPAGGFPSGPLTEGTAVRVMTGAPVPEGATGVIRLEHTDDAADGRVAIHSDSDAHRNIRRAGEDLRRGEPILPAGSEVSPSVVGSLAAMGHPHVEVRRRPRVGVLSNGDELAGFEELGEVLAGRRIMNSNSHGLCAALEAAGAVPVDLGIARDDAADVGRRLQAVGELDALITSAGVSVGDHDHVKQALEALGMVQGFWRVRMRPGSPIAFGVLDGRPVFGLPGNPVSVMVTFLVFVEPALRALAGHAASRRSTLRATAGEEIPSPEELTHYFRVRLDRRPDGELRARLTGPQGSGMLSSMVSADGLAVVPEGTGILHVGDPVTVIPLRSWTR